MNDDSAVNMARTTVLAQGVVVGVRHNAQGKAEIVRQGGDGHAQGVGAGMGPGRDAELLHVLPRIARFW